uniref:SAC domain-containing protein n=1 Tax=Angiostrongylus cantonensis TaxID=6313 RepID=A0A158P8H0_ANGCA
MRGRIRRVTVYETIDRFYVVGCDVSGMRFRLLKLDRIDSKTLLTGEPECDYTKEEILELLATVTESNFGKCLRGISGRSNRRDTQSLVERISNAFGLLGVVKFLEGYYIIVVTKANIVATLGYHYFYKIAEVAMISLAMDGSSPSSEEQRYVKLFQSVDLSTDFYFSYTYDLSRSLQENVISADWDKDGRRQLNSDQKFVWNSFLLEPLRNNLVSEHWLLEIVHGSLELHLFRSQILWDVSSSPNFNFGRFSAFVQRRGSVPLRWSQDPATRGVVGKPLIRIDIHEPHAQTAAAHFRELRAKYGNPIIVMNLVKRREKRRHESLLHDQFLKAVNYLNQFLPLSENICYLSFDVARCNKLSSVSSNVLTKMEEIGFKAVQAHGWFQSFPMPYTRSIDYRSSLPDFKPLLSADKRFLLQQGISRTNCVDCLDRTNVAQFGIGRVALACQLYAMGVLDNPCLSLQSELCRAFEDMFDDHGNTLAWQYAGSQLVHSIKTYKKISAFQERSRDVIQTLSRYYSNTFGDYDKQAAINLFLGVFRPQISSNQALWDLTTDYYLHFPTHIRLTTDYCAWMYDDDCLEKMISAEYGKSEAKEERHDYAKIRRDDLLLRVPLQLSSLDDFHDFYRIFEMTTLENRVKTQVGDSKEKTKKAGRGGESDDEDDDTLEEEQIEDEVVQCEPTWVRLINRSIGDKPCQHLTRSRRDINVLASGLLFAKEIYGIGSLSPSSNTRTFYENYAINLILRFNLGSYFYQDWINHKPTVLTDLNIPSIQYRPTIFTTDDVFKVKLIVSSKFAKNHAGTMKDFADVHARSIEIVIEILPE